MASWIFQGTASADRFTGRLADALRDRGFVVGHGRAHALVGRRRLARLFVHVAPDPEGVLVQARTGGWGAGAGLEALVFDAARDVQHALVAEARP